MKCCWLLVISYCFLGIAGALISLTNKSIAVARMSVVQITAD